MVDGIEIWITCKRLKLMRKAGSLQLIPNSAPSTIVWCQCEIWIENKQKLHCKVVYFLWDLGDLSLTSVTQPIYDTFVSSKQCKIIEEKQLS